MRRGEEARGGNGGEGSHYGWGGRRRRGARWEKETEGRRKRKKEKGARIARLRTNSLLPFRLQTYSISTARPSPSTWVPRCIGVVFPQWRLSFIGFCVGLRVVWWAEVVWLRVFTVHFRFSSFSILDFD
ncbi:hypothetical protein Droror1_Dr00006532 [Drosera rotundifolia]